MLTTIQIETANGCNLRCPYCLHGIKPQKMCYMKWEHLTKIYNELVDYNKQIRIELFGINEPLMDDRIFDIISLYQQIPKSHTVIITNGVLLSLKIVEKLFQSGLGQLLVSARPNYNPNISEYQKYQVSVKDLGPINCGAGKISMPQNSKHLSFNCLRPNDSLNIRYTGKLKLCCIDSEAEVFSDDLNIDNYTLKELWCCQPMQFYRSKLQNGRKNLKFCNLCDDTIYANRVIPAPQPMML